IAVFFLWRRRSGIHSLLCNQSPADTIDLPSFNRLLLPADGHSSLHAMTVGVVRIGLPLPVGPGFGHSVFGIIDSITRAGISIRLEIARIVVTHRPIRRCGQTVTSGVNSKAPLN